MQAWRQLGGGVIIGIFSAILVIGGIFLSLAENRAAAATPTQIPPTLPQSFPTPTVAQTETSITTLPTITPPVIGLPSATASIPAVATQTSLPPTSCTPPSGWIRVTVSTSDTVYSLAQRYRTSAENLTAANCLTAVEVPAGFALFVPSIPTVTVIPCGPPAGWVRNYIVQPGDTLFRIALAYNITYPQLQRANCMGSSTAIYTGQRLWVPNLPHITVVPAVTTPPSYP
jgi:LysM repeat protein